VRSTEDPVEDCLLDRLAGELPADVPPAVDDLVEVRDPRRPETAAVTL
jgi:hypothetical protein